MKNVALGLLLCVAITGCARLGMQAIRYDDKVRSPTPPDVFIPIYDSREDVPIAFAIIGEVRAAPMRMERDLGYKPLVLLKKQAREMGGLALLDLESDASGRGPVIWKAKVIIPK